MDTNTQKGSVSINTENIFPIIKKWLYSEKDIFLREIVSNAGDAISKLKKLAAVGEAELPEDNKWKIEVILDAENKTVTVHDNGIGMTFEEVEKYINQIAFSGAKDFIEKYEGKTDGDQIIGHFGLGFYSAFMVSDKVEIDTLSHIPGSKAVHWESEDGMNFEMGESELTERGTYITMHISEDGKEFLTEYSLREILEKYFSFFPVEIYLLKAEDVIAGEESKEEEKDGDVDTETKKAEAINDTAPLWLRNARDCTDEEYKEFYSKTFNDYDEPLFWIHLNVDYPFNLKGILYFPKLKDRYDTGFEGQIKVYYNQVFVADNIKEILPEFLMLLKGVIDCPDLPLNVSRSFLQNDGYVAKISTHITKKVADKLNGLFNNDRENYCKYWDDINPFVKFGCLKDEKLYEKIKGSIIYKTTDNEYMTAEEYVEKYKEKMDGKTVYYTDDTTLQAQYIRMLADTGVGIAVMDGPIDNHFMQFVEYKNSETFKFARIDSDVASSLKTEQNDEDKEVMTALSEAVTESFRTISSNDKLTVKTEPVNSVMPALILLSEQGRRMQDMMKQFGGKMNFPVDDQMTLVLNYNNATVKKLTSLKDKDSEKYRLVCEQIYDIARLAHTQLDAEALARFIERSGEILGMAINETEEL